MKRSMLLVMCALLLVCGTATNADILRYGIRYLGMLGGYLSEAHAINNLGQVAGHYNCLIGGKYYQRAFLWSPADGMADIGALPGCTSSIARDINDSGVVVGYSWTGLQERATLWNPDGSTLELGTLGGAYSRALGLNNTGQATGYSDTTAGHCSAFLWSEVTGMRDLGTLPGTGSPTSWGRAINEPGQVAGSICVSYGNLTVARAAFWDTDGSVRALDALERRPSHAFGVNDAGQAAGEAEDAAGRNRPVVWNADGSIIWLPVPMGCSHGEAYNLNNLGQVVGAAAAPWAPRWAVLWNPDGGIVELGALPGHNGSAASDINDAGLIAGYSVEAGLSHAVLWTPVFEAEIEIEPETLALSSRGPYVTCYMELPADAPPVEDVDLPSLRLQNSVPPASFPWEIADGDGDSNPDLMVKFSREALCSLLSPGEQTVSLSGRFTSGQLLEGTDTIRVIGH